MKHLDRDQQVAEHFAEGIHNHFIKLKMIKAKPMNPKIYFLPSAMKIQKTYRGGRH